MTDAQRRTLERHLDKAVKTPLTDAIRAALDELDEMKRCPECKGNKTVYYTWYGMAPCSTCEGSGRRL